MANRGIKKIFVTPLTDVASSDLEGIGVLRFEGNKVYKYMKIQNTTATVAGVAGDAVLYAAATGYSTNTVVIDATDGDSVPFGAGLLMGSVTGTAGTAYYGWIQLKGLATAGPALAGSPSDGHALAASTTDKTLTRKNGAGAGTASINRVAIAIDASAKLICCDFPF